MSRYYFKIPEYIRTKSCGPVAIVPWLYLCHGESIPFPLCGMINGVS